MLGCLSTIIFKKKLNSPLRFGTVILAGTLSLLACNYQIVKTAPEPMTQGAWSEKSKIEGRLVQESVLSSCGRCHGTDPSTHLTSLTWIVSNIGNILKDVESNRMPLGNPGPLSPCQKEILRSWVALGMPEQSSLGVMSLASCQKEQPEPPKKAPLLEMPLTYETLHSEILLPRCLGCHNEKNETDAVSFLFSPYEKMKETFTWTDSPTDSRKLLEVVTAPPPAEGEESKMMPPPDSEPPFDPTPLTETEVEFVRRWLEAGHPE